MVSVDEDRDIVAKVQAIQPNIVINLCAAWVLWRCGSWGIAKLPRVEASDASLMRDPLHRFFGNSLCWEHDDMLLAFLHELC